MSRTKKGAPKLGGVPSKFKQQQSRSKKRKQKESDKKLFANPEEAVSKKFKKSHRWDYF